MVYHVLFAMQNPRPFLLLLLIALSLGLAWPLLGFSSIGGIRFASLDGASRIVDAREPALRFPGPELHWKTDTGSATMAWDGAKWDDVTSPSEHSFLHSGSLFLETNPSLAPASFSASSLRNGVARGSDGTFLGWSPDFANDAEGHAFLVFDRFHKTSFDVVLHEGNGLDLTETVLASSQRFEAHASLATDSTGRLWVAWDESDDQWGRGSGLHESRSLRLIMRDASGWHQVELPSSQDLLMENGIPGAPYLGMPELPRLVMEEDGALWMFYRVMRPFTKPDSHTASRRIAWEIRATVLTAKGWCQPFTLPQSDGPNHDTLAVVAMPDGGVVAAWTADGRMEHFSDLKIWGESVMTESVLHSAFLQREESSSLGDVVPGLSPWTVRPAEMAPVGSDFIDTPSENKIGPPGMLRLWGDLHRHSDLSRCSMDTDGSVPDQFRYAAGPGALDFVAVTDHHQHLSGSSWKFLLDATDRFHGAQDLVTLYGFEYAFPDGHRNLICADRSAAIDAPSLSRLGADLSLFDAKDFIAIPHQIAETKSVLDWDIGNQELETQVEIYQRRGSYENRDGIRTPRQAVRSGKFVRDYLQEGKRFGFLASSDHQFSNGAFAVVYAKGRDRESIMEALRARRSYAATARIDLDVQLNGLLMGEAGEVAADAKLEIVVDAKTELACVEVIRNGEVAHVWSGVSRNTEYTEGLLSLRFGQITGRPDLPLHGKGIEFGEAILMDGETGAASYAPQGQAWSKGIFLRYLSQRPQSLGGWVIPVRWKLPLDQVEVALGNGSQRPAWNGEEMTAGSEWVKKYWGKPVSLRLAPQKLGSPTLNVFYQPQDWKQGDWVYVRVIRVDGAMAWSSPIWIDEGNFDSEVTD